jgi:hypothetical protein
MVTANSTHESITIAHATPGRPRFVASWWAQASKAMTPSAASNASQTGVAALKRCPATDMRINSADKAPVGAASSQKT